MGLYNKSFILIFPYIKADRPMHVITLEETAYIVLIPPNWVIKSPVGRSIFKKGKKTQQKAAPIKAKVEFIFDEVY